MKNFKKRTIALVLASVITVAGSFAAANYKNSLMSLKFDTAANGNINMSVETRTAYSGNVTPVRRDANTYTLTLAEMNSMVKGMPNLEKVSGNISSVEIKTLPYSNNAKGYTRVIIKTYNPVNIQAENKIYIPSANESTGEITTNHTTETVPQEEVNKSVTQKIPEPQSYNSENSQNEQETNNPEVSVTDEIQTEAAQTENQNFQNTTTPKIDRSTIEYTAQKDPYEVLLIVMGILAVFGVIAFLAVRASNKIQEVTGEKIDIDTTDDQPSRPKQESKRKKIKNTIKQLDSAYSKTAVRQASIITHTPAKPPKPEEELNVVDLDELFKEQQEKTKEVVSANINTDDDENNALTEFLSGFSFDEKEEEKPVTEEETIVYDEEFYNKIIEENNITFTQDDIDCMKQLLHAEINDETFENINSYAASNPIKPVSKNSILENLIATYKISQDITFNHDDIETLKKLINVELDEDFITDLRTNPERTKEMQQEIEASKNKSRKPSEILTLNVKDMLPDLSEALRNQGGKKIESEVKPITVYASEGYEVSTLSLSDELPDLSKELNNQNAYISQPSAEFELVDNSYEVEKLRLTDALPDLNDALKNPEKYEKPEVKPTKIDEDALLKNISNVQFKPFYDGSENFEIINDFETPSMDDIQNEFNQFGNFEISQEEDIQEVKNNDYDDFKSLYTEEYFDLDKIQKSPVTPEQTAKETLPQEEIKPVEKEIQEPVKEEFKPLNLERNKRENILAARRAKTQNTEELLKKIKEDRTKKLKYREQAIQRRAISAHKKYEKTATKQSEIKCIIEGETFTIISTAEFSENKGCHLARTNNGYAVLGFIGDKFIKIKEFDNLKSEKIAARLSEKLPDGTSRYIVRIGLNKFVLNVTNDNIEYLMTL